MSDKGVKNKGVKNKGVKNKNIMNMNYKREKHCIISSKNNNIYCDDLAKSFISNDDFLKNKSLITISPGGFKGFYLLGILTYIKENYDIENCIYSGASAGSWNSLFMCYKGDSLPFVYNLLDYNIRKIKSITEIEYYIKYKLLSKYNEEDFDLRRLFIGVTTVKNFTPLTNIFSDFENLEDAINCCIASSHIPLITGGFTNKYHNMYTYDGGFSNYPYLQTDNVILHVTPSMWYEFEKNKQKHKQKNKQIINKIKKFSEYFSISKNNLLELFDDGYQDAKTHKKYFDDIFTPLKKYNDDDVNENGIEI